MRSVREAPGIGRNGIPRTQREQENIFPQLAHNQDQGERNTETDESMYEMS